MGKDGIGLARIGENKGGEGKKNKKGEGKRRMNIQEFFRGNRIQN